MMITDDFTICFCFLQADNEEDSFFTDTEKETADSTINSQTVASKYTV